MVAIYVAMDGTLKKGRESFGRVVAMVSYAMMTNFEEAEAFVLDCEKKDNRLIFYYPAFGEVDTSAWEFVGDMLDGGLYVGKE